MNSTWTQTDNVWTRDAWLWSLWLELSETIFGDQTDLDTGREDQQLNLRVSLSLDFIPVDNHNYSCQFSSYILTYIFQFGFAGITHLYTDDDESAATTDNTEWLL